MDSSSRASCLNLAKALGNSSGCRGACLALVTGPRLQVGKLTCAQAGLQSRLDQTMHFPSRLSHSQASVGGASRLADLSPFRFPLLDKLLWLELGTWSWLKNAKALGNGSGLHGASCAGGGGGQGHLQLAKLAEKCQILRE